ncbi:MAG: peptidylprolyl isomerase [Sphingopyxis sp.]|uniref:peptidylprolyl isomerase n=1 Tax=Sphingopyxis sp. TaxID=1908224 RepID=UPI002ABCF7B0|nr:peptidylprolyl isomerase [Sphingopyxis sp.]MDZ3831709.1 peptidylprolyl isomerase [Sphingopyxis sp.]
MTHRFLAAAAALALVPAALAQQAPPSPGEIVGAAPAADWVAVPPDDLLVMDLAPDRAGKDRRIVIQLMPAPFSQGWIGNIRKLAAAHWWDGMAVTRVQDNYVAQWGDPDGEDAAKAKPLPGGLATMPEHAYLVPAERLPLRDPAPGEAGEGRRDPYAASTGFFSGWPMAFDRDHRWPVHCYGAVGVGRNFSPDTGSGAELYAVIGHAPRHLDRNIALVGRVVSGIEHLSSLPRGTGALGFYENPAERVPIRAIRLASDLPPTEQPRFEYLSTESDSFARYSDARANRRDPFFIAPAGGADICNIPVPVRAAGAK